MKENRRIAILGAGNIGSSIARGLISSGNFEAEQIALTRRRVHLLEEFREIGVEVTDDNIATVRRSETLIIAVEPQQFDALLEEIHGSLDPGRHTLISVVSDVSIDQIRRVVGKQLRVVRAMPNTGIAIGESMTCLAADQDGGDAVDTAESIFKSVGRTLVIDEEQMTAATALGACGIAFFLRAIRSASQGGIEIGFHSDEAILIASQTARGAASLLLSSDHHPEHEIDRVTTPRGCTISGLNQMEHSGFSSAMIKGIITSARKASRLYQHKD